LGVEALRCDCAANAAQGAAKLSITVV